jgi:hypothetical protein
MACAAAILFVMVGWMLSAYGLTLVVTHSSIMAPLRALLAPYPFFGRLVKCPMCFGWWAGGLLGAPVALRLAPLASRALGVPITPLDIAFIIFAACFASSGLNWAIFVETSRRGALKHLGMEPDRPPTIISLVRRPRR